MTISDMTLVISKRWDLYLEPSADSRDEEVLQLDVSVHNAHVVDESEGGNELREARVECGQREGRPGRPQGFHQVLETLRAPLKHQVHSGRNKFIQGDSGGRVPRLG